MPSISNPLGLGHKAMPLACKVQNLLIADFLHYLALRHGVYLSTMGGDVKKLYDEALTHSGIIDPLAELDIDIQSLTYRELSRYILTGPVCAGGPKHGSITGKRAKHRWRLSENKRYASSTTTSRKMYGWKSSIPNRWKFTTTPSSRQKSNY